MAIFAAIVGLISSGHSSDSIVIAEQKPSLLASESTSVKPSIDQVAATSLAADLADIADLPVATNVANEAISLNTKNELAQNDDNTISKPQIVQPVTAVARSVTSYKAKTGDTVDSVAKKFHLKKDTIKWSNNMQSDALEPGRKVIIPPVDGIVSTAKKGDTIQSLAKKYKTSPERIVLYNDLGAEDAIKAGKKIVIPGGSVNQSLTETADAVIGGQPGGFNPSARLSPSVLLAGGNLYDYGYCTWYVYERRAELGMPINNSWGNASSWAPLAGSDGFLVNNHPAVGSILQTPNAAGGDGHVAIVESINGNGSIFVSEMNFRGWGIKSTRTIRASNVSSYNYIH